ncbi:UNVERIFIED_CONTAM: hypothetical protein NCL1_18958 [Trichonephila clavipes]
MACDAEDYGLQMQNDEEIVTSMQKESDPVDDETDEDEDNNMSGFIHCMDSIRLSERCPIPIDSDKRRSTVHVIENGMDTHGGKGSVY